MDSNIFQLFGILKECTVEGLVIKLPPQQLSRDLYNEVKKALELIGGKWKSGKTQGFVFEQDPTELLATITNGKKVNLKKEHQFFATPAEVADRMAAEIPVSSLHDGYKILEPSAGDGALVKALERHFGFDVLVDVYESMDLNRMKLAKLANVTILGEDFLTCDAIGLYDIVFANPPFTKGQDIAHVLKMYEVCKPGGMVITLASPFWTFGSQKKQVEFKAWLEAIGATITEIEEGAFKSSGTTIRTMMLVINKPAEDIAVPELSESPESVPEIPVAAAEPGERLSDAELQEFKEMIEKKLAGAQKEFAYLNGLINPEDATKKPEKMKLEQFEQMAARQQTFIGNLEKALGRIEDKTYGVCATTGRLIDKSRLRAVPHALLSTEAKMGPKTTPSSAETTPTSKKKKEKAHAAPERKCRVCGCTEDNCAQCIKLTGGPCHWVEKDLCSACVVVKEKPEDETTAANEDDQLAAEEVQETIPAEEPIYYQLDSVDEPTNFFSLIHGMINGLDVDLQLHRIGDLLQVAVVPQTKTSIKPFKIKGLPAEIDAAFFKVLTGPLKDLEDMKIDLTAETRKSNIPTSEPLKKEKVENPRSASKKIAAKKLDKKTTVPKKQLAKAKPVAPDMFANLV